MATRAQRHLRPLFLATVLALVAALAWMGVQLLRQERALLAQRVREQCDAAADVATAALHQHLAAAEERISSAANGNASWASALSPDSALMLIRAGRMEVLPERRLLFRPDEVKTAPQATALFAEADILEFRKQAYLEAAASLRTLVRHAEAPVRAEAQLRLARCLWKAGDAAAAIPAYDQLEGLGDVLVGGLPAGLAAHEGRMLVYEARGDRASLRREAEQICTSLHAAEWSLSRRLYEFYRSESCGRANPVPADPPEALALAMAAEEAWALRRQPGSGRRIVWHDGLPVLLLWKTTVGQTAALALGRGHIQDKWLVPLADVRISLSDPDGHVAVGAALPDGGIQAVRLASATRLPWTLHAFPAEALSSETLPARQQLVLAVLGTLVLLVLTGVYFMGRAVARELEVGRLQSDFVASISHEFRSPIAALRQLSEMLDSGRPIDDAERREFYRAMAVESERLHRLVEGLLNFGRLEAGEAHMRMEALDPSEVLESVAEEFQRSADAKAHRIQVRSELVPPACVQGDRAALVCVIWNLLENAVKYSPGSDSVEAEIDREPGKIAIQVRDRGIGIPREEQQRIFDKFVRGAGARDLSVRGTGVGLAIVSRIVEAHRGSVAVESAPGAGSVFTVRLPEVN